VPSKTVFVQIGTTLASNTCVTFHRHLALILSEKISSSFPKPFDAANV
jgi:hypothetical protein